MKSIFHKIFATIDRAMECIIVVIFLLMVCIGGLQTFSRYVLQHSLSWSEESQKFLHIWLVFLAIPLAYKHGMHIGMNVLFDKMPRKVQFLIKILIDFLWCGWGVVMMFYTLRIIKVARMQISPGLGLRMDWVYYCIFIGGAYLSFMALRKICSHFITETNEE